ncbi:hypothetical protein KM043_009185 [Ampulex compressa]|nr:hypothetical protein KM043_009185 [Ampulex compressa]
MWEVTEIAFAHLLPNFVECWWDALILDVLVCNGLGIWHVYEFPPSHPFVVARLVLIGVIVAPSVRQYYMYVTDPTCSRVGTQCWVYGAIMVTEALLCIRHGSALFERTQALNILLWLLCQSLVSVLCVYGCVLWHQYFETEKKATIKQTVTQLDKSRVDASLCSGDMARCSKSVDMLDKKQL